MINYYFKQAWTMIKQNKLFSFIYVMGTGLSIALVMIVSIIFYVKWMPVYPEYNRNETVALKYMCVKNDSMSTSNASSLSYQFLTNMAPKLASLKHIAAFFNWKEATMVRSNEKQESISISPLFVNSDFWNVFTFQFIDGHPFDETDVQTIQKKAVISKSLSQRLFATSESVNRTFEMDGEEFIICGVVKDVSSVTPVTAADLWVPLNLKSSEFVSNNPEWMIGPIEYYMLPVDGQKQALKEEVVRLFDELNSDSDSWIHDLMGQPDDYWLSTFRVWSNQGPDLMEVFKEMGVLLLAFILIPAINLSGMISSRMDKRLCEIGLRKAYGATRGNLMSQILWENLLLTCLGGLMGLILSYIIVVTSSSWIFTIFDDFIEVVVGTSITPEMLFNPFLFLISFGVCVVLNLVSTLIPTINAMRRSIIYSLNTRK